MTWFAWIICWWRGHDWGEPIQLYEGSDNDGKPLYSWYRECRRCYDEEDYNPSELRLRVAEACWNAQWCESFPSSGGAEYALALQIADAAIAAIKEPSRS